MQIKKLLFVTDFEELWFDALQSLMDLRKVGLNHVVFLHVIEREKVAMRRGTGYLKGEELKLKEMANVRFIDWAESLFEMGMECGAYVVVGDPVPKILSTAEVEKVDIIVTGRHKKAKTKGLYIDSQTLELLRRTTVPVLVHKYMTKDGKVNKAPFEKPLLATDWSAPCARAIEYILGLKNITKKVEIIHILTEKEMEGHSKTELQKIEKESKKRLEEVRLTFEGAKIEADTHLYVGQVAEQIGTAARELNATMIVTGSTGKGAWRARWLGSVSHEVAEKIDLPTLLVP